MRHDPEVQQALSRYQLGLPRIPVAGRSGELMGRGTGSSLEFQEFREYQIGDDIRHLDWAAYARSDTLMVRMYREEISPRTEIYIDASRSMATGDGSKEHRTKQVANLFIQLTARLGGRPGIFLLNDQRPLPTHGLELLDNLDAVSFDGHGSLPELLSGGMINMRPQSVRIVISDFLFPHEPQSLIRRLAAGAGVLWVVQVLSGWEANPTEEGGRRLVDVENGLETDLLLNKQAIAMYKQRLITLQEELSRQCRRVHAPFSILTSDRSLLDLCSDDLSASGMLRSGV